MLARVTKFVMLLLLSWVVMTFTHEMGHIIGGWCSGAKLQDADLLPWHLPHSRFQPDPMPLVTLWSGPVLGVLVPLLVASLFRRNWVWFIAYFCLLANGVYLALAWLTGDRLLDTTRLLEHGAHPASIVVFCIVTIVPGYFFFRRSCSDMLSSSSAEAPPTADRSRV